MKIKSQTELQVIIAKLKTEGKKIVLVKGVFDLVHVGHLTYLQHAKMLGDVLLVAINTDKAVRKRKGEPRPIFAHRDRMKLIAAFECVDYVTWYEELTPVELIKTLRPDPFVTSHTSYLNARELAEIRKYTEVIIRSKEGNASTTELVKMILKKWSGRANPLDAGSEDREG